MRPFDSIVAEHGRTVLRVCRAVLDSSDVDDAWSETFLAALRAYPALPTDANVEAWLVTIAKRKAIDIIRSRTRLPIPVDELPESLVIAAVPVAESAELWRAVASLPTKQRLCVGYHYLFGLPHLEVARIVGGTPEASRRAASDGLAALRTLLAQGGD